MGINLIQPSSDADLGAKRAARVIELIEDMRDDFNVYDWGTVWTTLDSIYDQASHHGYVTPGQLTAVENIKSSGDEKAERVRRRYRR